VSPEEKFYLHRKLIHLAEKNNLKAFGTQDSFHRRGLAEARRDDREKERARKREWV
jgi:hypothetical protein